MQVRLGIHFFKKKGQWKKFNEKPLNFSEHHPQSCSEASEKDIAKRWKRKENYINL